MGEITDLVSKAFNELQKEIDNWKETNKINFDMLWEALEIVKNMKEKPDELKEWRIQCLKKMGLM
jgi:hypothetical protein